MPKQIQWEPDDGPFICFGSAKVPKGKRISIEQATEEYKRLLADRGSLSSIRAGLTQVRQSFASACETTTGLGHHICSGVSWPDPYGDEDIASAPVWLSWHSVNRCGSCAVFYGDKLWIERFAALAQQAGAILPRCLPVYSLALAKAEEWRRWDEAGLVINCSPIAVWQTMLYAELRGHHGRFISRSGSTESLTVDPFFASTQAIDMLFVEPPTNTSKAQPAPPAAGLNLESIVPKKHDWHPVDFTGTVDPGMQQAIRLIFPDWNLPSDLKGPNWGLVWEKLRNPGGGKTPRTPAEIDTMTMFEVRNAFNAIASDGTTRPILAHTSEFSHIVQDRGRPAKPGEETQPAKKRTTDDDARESAAIELEELPPRLSPKDQAVMLAMENFGAAECPTISQIAEATNGAVSDKTTGDVVARFETLGFAERPGKRQGARLTTKGRRQAARIKKVS